MRKPYDEFFMDLAKQVSTRGTCDRAQVGCVIVNNSNRIVSTGYNGSISGNDHCDDVGHVIRDDHCIATIHAEINALAYCAKEGVAVKGCTAYVTHFPCLNCTKALIQSGITAVYYDNDYRIDSYALQLMDDAGVKCRKI